MEYLYKNISIISLFFFSFSCVSQLDTIAIKHNEINFKDQGFSLFDFENNPLNDGIYFVNDKEKREISFGEVLQGKKKGLWIYSSIRYEDKVLEYYFDDTCLTVVVNLDLNVKSINIRKVEKDSVNESFVGIFDDNQNSLFRMVFRIDENNRLTLGDFAIEFYGIRVDDFSDVPDRLRRFNYYSINKRYW